MTRHNRRCLARTVAAALALALVLAGCGSSGSPDRGPADRAAGEVTVKGAYGEVTVTPTDTNVWALDPAAAIELLALGVEPTHVGEYAFDGDAAYQARERILRDAGIEIVKPDSLELIAAAQPDLIVGYESPTTAELIDSLEKIAPVVVADRPWDRSLATLAAATGKEKKAEAIAAHLDARVADTRADLEAAGHQGETVSMISACGLALYCVYGSGRTAGTLLTDLGFERPVGQRRNTDSGFTTISEERLGDHVARIVFVLAGSVQAGAKSPVHHPLFDASDSITDQVDFSAWFGASSFDVPWILNDIRAILLDEGDVADTAEGLRLFEELADAGTR